MSDDLTPEKAAFIEAKTKELFAYTLECLDRARTEGNNIIQWLFAVVLGGLGIVGSVFSKGYWQISFGAFAAACWGAWLATKLVPEMKSNDTMPPGNRAEILNKILDEPEYRMRWREAMGMDARIKANNAHVTRLTTAIDDTRRKFTWLPLFFLGGVIAAWLAGLLWCAAVWLYKS